MFIFNISDQASTNSHFAVVHLSLNYTVMVQLELHYTFIACWWGKYENLFTQEYHIPWGHRPRGIWYSWV